jgi:hypothetical protein
VYILALAFWAVLSFFVSSQLFRWEPETKIPRNAKLWALATIIPFVLLGFWEHGKGSMVAEAQAAYKAVNQRANDPAQEVPKN